MTLWLRMALDAVRVNRGFSFFFVFNLAIGLAGFVAVLSFGRSLDRHMDNNLKEILTADMVLSASSPMTGQELALADRVLGRDKAVARLVAFYSMVQAGTLPQARLVRIMAVGKAYPLYGKFVLEKGGDVSALQQGPGLLMTRDTAHTLGIEAESALPLRIGDKDFCIQDFFLNDPDKSLTAVDLAPKVYMGLDQLADTGLVRFGSRIRYFYFYRFPPGTDVAALARALDARFFETSGGQPRINVFDTRDVNRQLGRLTRYFTGYMGLVAIVALFLAGISGAYLFRGMVAARQKEMAILMSLGGQRREIYGFVSFQLVLLGTAAAVLAVGASFLLLPVFPVIFKGMVPQGLVIRMDGTAAAVALGMGIGGSLVFCLPAFVRLFGIRPLDLLRGAGTAEKNRFRIWGGLSFVPVLAAFLGVSMAVAGAARDGMVFSAGCLLAMVLLSLAGTLVFRFCGRLSLGRAMAGFLPGKIALRNLFRNRWSSLSCFVTIAMGVFLITLIPQIRKGLEGEIMRPEGLKLPVFFLVDIQDEQKADLEAFMGGSQGDLSHISPVVNGRILTVNGQPFFGRPQSTSRQGAPGPGNRRGRRGIRRLEFIFSYRDTLADSETLVRGHPMTTSPWDFTGKAPFEISMAVSFANRFGFKIGDLIGFDVQGISMEGRVVNLRKVRWNSFQPNFFLLFQNGVLNDAPKTHLGAISNVPPELRKALKNRLVSRFPNISVIDVTQTAATILGVTDRLLLSVRFMAWLAMGAGLVSIFSIARHEARRNRNQINLLKVLGCDFKMLRQVILLEFGVMGFTASLFAVVLSMGFSWAVSWYFFDRLWAFDPLWLGGILAGATGVCMATGLWAALKVMRGTPLSLLSGK
ncbi:MAG: ABC transporter permease [Desulfobacter sp.]|nr:MAG: ABC transporter permease [Desulfobacter sp.]